MKLILFLIFFISSYAYSQAGFRSVLIEGKKSELNADVICDNNNSNDTCRLAVTSEQSAESTAYIGTSKYYKSNIVTTDVNLTGSYVTVFNLTGPGRFHHLQMEPNTDDFYVKIIIDGSTAFDLYMQDIKQFYLTCDHHSATVCYQTNIFDFAPYAPIYFDTSFEVQIKGTSGKVVQHYIYFWEDLP